jgi:hypothetical protein
MARRLASEETAAASPDVYPSSSARDAAPSSWVVPVAALATTSIVVGTIWDISWHRTIGRDTFWTPAHLAIYLGGVLAGLSGAWQVVRATWGSPSARPGVRVWGLCGPVGAWVGIWGAAAMLVSAPFDDWWHNAYGLDVEILSPPHSLLGLGVITIQLGALLVILSHLNRSAEAGRGPLAVAFAYGAGALLLMTATLLTEWNIPNMQHRADFYMIGAGAYPVLLLAVARAAPLRWPATTAAALYMAVSLAMTWILPLFPGRPLLGPILNPVDHMVPPPFPVLLVLPALAVDLLLRHARGNDWTLAALAGPAFLAVFFLAQFWFSEFLLTSHARNWFFAADRWDYSVLPGEWRYRFWGAFDVVTAPRLAAAALVALASARLGLALGRWMRGVVR